MDRGWIGSLSFMSYIVVFLLLESPSTAGKYHGFGMSVTFMFEGMTKCISNDLNSIILALLCKPVTVILFSSELQ